MKEYFVLDGENNTVWAGREKYDAPQAFKTFAAAEKRAKAYAKTVPGEPVRIVGVEAIVVCDVVPAKTHKIK